MTTRTRTLLPFTLRRTWPLAVALAAIALPATLHARAEPPVTVAAPPTVPAAASAATPASWSEVSMDLTIAGPMPTVLRGTLTLPAHAAHPRVALIVGGSGPTDRNGNTPPMGLRNQHLALLAHALADRGIATVRYDKRGIGASSGGIDEATLRLDTYADDAAAWLRQLAHDPRFASVTAIGHSEGALLVSMAAQRAPVASLVAIAGTARRASVLIREQTAGKLPPPLAAENERVLASLEAGHVVADAPEALSALYRPSVQPYLISWIARDPAAELKAVPAPVLVVRGEADHQVPLADGAALAQAHAGAVLVTVPRMSHVLKAAGDDDAAQTTALVSPDLPLADGLVGPIADFIDAH